MNHKARREVKTKKRVSVTVTRNSQDIVKIPLGNFIPEGTNRRTGKDITSDDFPFWSEQIRNAAKFLEKQKCSKEFFTKAELFCYAVGLGYNKGIYKDVQHFSYRIIE